VSEGLAGAVRERLPDVYEVRGETVAVVDRDDLLGALGWLRDQGVIDLVACVTVSDWPGADPRFWVSYDLRSLEAPVRRLRLKVGLAEGDPHVPSVTEMFPGAGPWEREQFDLFGVIFDGHPDLTRVLLPDDWEGHPLRKDEELGGVPTWFEGTTVPPIDRRGMA
jgi:NADH-quinone oxidoreductase subunit C